MSDFKYLIRLASDGGKAVTATLQAVGDTGVASFQKLDKQINLSNVQFDKFTTITKRSVAAITAATAALAYMTQRKMEAIDSNSKLAQSFDVTYQTMVDNALVAEEQGLSIEKLAKAWNDLNTKLADGSGKKAIEGLGLSVKDLLALSPDQQFAKVAQAISEIDDENTKAAYSAAIFGKEQGRALLPLMEDYAEKVAEASAFNEKFGISLSQIETAQVEAANDAMSRVKSALGGIVNTIAVQVSPAIQAVGEWLVSLGYEKEEFANGVAKSMDFIAQLADKTRLAWHGLVAGIGVVNVAVAEVELFVVTAMNRIGTALSKVVNLVPGVNMEASFSESDIAAAQKSVDAAKQELERRIKVGQDSQKTENTVKYSLDRAREKSLNDALAAGNDRIGKGGTSPLSLALSDEADKAAKVVEQLIFRNEQLGRSNEEQELYNQLKAAGVDLESEYGQKIKEQIDIWKQKTDEIERAEAATKALEKASSDAIDRIIDDLGDGKLSWEGLTQAALEYIKTIATAQTKDGQTIGGDILGSIWGSIKSSFKGFSVGISNVPHDMPAILHKGEEVSTADKVRNERAKGGGDISIVVNNTSRSKVSPSVTENPATGMRQIKILIADTVADELRDPSSKVAQAARSVGSLS